MLFRTLHSDLQRQTFEHEGREGGRQKEASAAVILNCVFSTDYPVCGEANLIRMGAILKATCVFSSFLCHSTSHVEETAPGASWTNAPTCVCVYCGVYSVKSTVTFLFWFDHIWKAKWKNRVSNCCVEISHSLLSWTVLVGGVCCRHQIPRVASQWIWSISGSDVSSLKIHEKQLSRVRRWHVPGREFHRLKRQRGWSGSPQGVIQPQWSNYYSTQHRLRPANKYLIRQTFTVQ